MDRPLSDQEFKEIYQKVPRLCVEAVIYSEEKGILLTKRSIPPAQHLWHTPGGTVYYNERLEEAVQRIAKRELGTDVIVGKMLGIIQIRFEDYFYHDVTAAFLVTPVQDISINNESLEYGYFKNLPDDTIPEMREFYPKHLHLS